MISRRAAPDAELPRVCLVTPVFNGAAFIDQTIASVLTQSGDFLLHYHVQDGGSSDGTQRTVKKWMRRQRLGLIPRACRGITFTFASAPDRGMYDAINKGFAAALPPGDDVVMGWIAADDQIAPGAFATIIAVRAAFSDVRLIGGRMALLDEHGSITAIGAVRPFSRRAMAAGLYDGRQGRPFVMQEGTFWCADLWRLVGGLDARFSLAGDWDLWRRMAAKADYVSIDTALGFHRRRPGQLSEQMERYYAEVDALLDRPIAYGEAPTADPTLIEAGVIAADAPTTLRAEYDRVAIEHERLLADPPSFRASAHATTVLRFDLGRQTWGKAIAFAAPLLPTEVVEGSERLSQHPVLPLAGFDHLQDGRPDLGILDRMRWLNEANGTGEVVLPRDGPHTIILRYRAWQKNMAVTFAVDGRPIATLPLPGHGPEREVEVRATAEMRAGRNRIALCVQGADTDASIFILIGWTVQEASRAVPLARVAVATGVSRPTGCLRISVIVAVQDDVDRAAHSIAHLVAQPYPALQIVVAGSGPVVARMVERLDLSRVDALVVTADPSCEGAVLAAARQVNGDVIWAIRAGDRVVDGALQEAACAFDVANDAVVGVLRIEDHEGGASRILPGAGDLWGARALRRWNRATPATDFLRENVVTRAIGATLLTIDHAFVPPSALPHLDGVLAILPSVTAEERAGDYVIAAGLRELGAEIAFDAGDWGNPFDGRREPRALLVIGARDAPGTLASVRDARERGWRATSIELGPDADDARWSGISLPAATDRTLFHPGDRHRAKMLLGLPHQAFVVAISGPGPHLLDRLARSWSLLERPGDVVLLSIGVQDDAAEGLRIMRFGLERNASGRALLLQASDMLLADASTTDLARAEAAASGVAILDARDVLDAEPADMVAAIEAMRQPDPERTADLARARARVLNERDGTAIALRLLERLPPELGATGEALRRNGVVLAPEPRHDTGTLVPLSADWHAIAPDGCEPAILVRAREAGEFVCQLFHTETWTGSGGLMVNGAFAGGPLSVGKTDARFLLHLGQGWNRVTTDAPETARAWVGSITGVALWPARRTTADLVPDGLLTVDRGFRDREPADIASLLPMPFHRATVGHNLAWLASGFAGLRNFAVRLRNPFPEQDIVVRLGGDVAGTMRARDRVSDLTIVRCRGRFDRGFNPIVIAARMVGLDDLGRDLAFYLEDIHFFVELPADTDLVCWDESTGFGDLEAPVLSQDLPAPFRWMQADRASIVLERLKAEHVRITLHSRFLGPPQTIVVRVNGAEVRTETVEGMDLRAHRPIVAMAELTPGRNEIGIEIDAAGALGQDGRNLYLLLERLEIEALATR